MFIIFLLSLYLCAISTLILASFRLHSELQIKIHFVLYKHVQKLAAKLIRRKVKKKIEDVPGEYQFGFGR